ncbi:MAG: hemolysin family protein [Dehalococcoidia bacterium]|nr:hemolysin family protein [Dehalococcoidia bacterium]
MSPPGNGLGEEGTLRLRARALLHNGGVRTLIQLGLITTMVAASVTLIGALTSRWWSVTLGVVGLIVLLVVIRGASDGIGERWGGKAGNVIPLLWPLAMLAIPLFRLQSRITTAFSKRNGDSLGAYESSASLPGGVTSGISENQDGGDLAPHERRMITSILKLDETTAREIMVPRMDIQAAETTSSLLPVAKMMWETGHSRIPLFEESLDNIVGVVHSRDILRNLATEDTEVSLDYIVRPPLFIPVSKRLDDLLRDFQENHIQIAIVVDEYGGTAGLVTVEDLLEEIVGEIEDEFDIGEPLREMLSESEAIMDARISLEEVNQAFSVNLRGEGFDTLGGLLYQQLGKMPVPGDEAKVDGLTIKVISTMGRRIKQVQVARAVTSELG